MKPMLVALTLLGASLGAASAQGVEVDVGRGGVHVGPGYHNYDDWRWRHRYRETYGSGGCRVIIRNHVNRFGERVTVRRRVCD